jgi:predicted CXXCH cytochrome family protein
MKKYFFIALVVLLSMGLAATAMAQISNSVHDLRAPDISGLNEICVVCHTPHNAMDTNILWNHVDTANTSFTMYDSAYMEDAAPGAPTGVSKLCLSCHDGSTSIDAYGDVASPSVNISTFGTPPGSYTIGAGGDLSTTHPISIEYPDGASAGGSNDPDINVRAGTFTLGQTIGENLEGDLLQCSSCHDVHNSASEVASGTQLLREGMVGSALCLVCHDK